MEAELPSRMVSAGMPHPVGSGMVHTSSLSGFFPAMYVARASAFAASSRIGQGGRGYMGQDARQQRNQLPSAGAGEGRGIHGRVLHAGSCSTEDRLLVPQISISVASYRGNKNRERGLDSYRR